MQHIVIPISVITTTEEVVVDSYWEKKEKFFSSRETTTTSDVEFGKTLSFGDNKPSYFTSATWSSAVSPRVLELFEELQALGALREIPRDVSPVKVSFLDHYSGSLGDTDESLKDLIRSALKAGHYPSGHYVCHWGSAGSISRGELPSVTPACEAQVELRHSGEAYLCF